MKLSAILSRELIFEELTAQNRGALYAEMLCRAEKFIELPLEVSELRERLLLADAEHSGNFGPILLPHIRLENFSGLTVLIGATANPLTLEGYNDPIRLVILSLVGNDSSDLYLKMISSLARCLLSPAQIEEFFAAVRNGTLGDLLDRRNIILRASITAEDLMTVPEVSLKPEQTLAEALDLFHRQSRVILPVTDADGKFLGELKAIDIIRRFVPDYLFMLQSTGFIGNFEPFERIFNDEETSKVSEFVTVPPVTLKPDTPLIQFTIELCRGTGYLFFVTDAHGKLVGEVSVKNIIHRVLRG